jgi:hypothetical protein
MTTNLPRLSRTVLVLFNFYFAAITLMCWYFDLFVNAPLSPYPRHEFWVRLFFVQGVIAVPFVIGGCFYFWRRLHWLAVVGILSCLIWITWILLPSSIQLFIR